MWLHDRGAEDAGLMPIREVANSRDVRAPRLLPSAAQLSTVHSLRRAVSVITLIAIDTCCFLLAVALVPPASGLGWFTLWQGLSWWDVLLACAVLVVVAALKGLYGRRHLRRNARRILAAWTIAFVTTLVLLLVVGPVGI